MRIPFVVLLIAAALAGFGIVMGLTALVTPDDGAAGALPPEHLADYRTGTLDSLDFSYGGMTAPETVFTDPQGAETTLAMFQGKTVLVNLWATWCAPCIEELPTLAALQTDLGGALGADRFEVIAINAERGDGSKGRAFLDDNGLDALAFYHNPTSSVVLDLGAPGLPVTILFGPDGREIARVLGPAHWNAPEVHDFIRAAIDHAETEARS